MSIAAPVKKAFWVMASALMILEFILLFGNYRILIRERRVPPGEDPNVEQYSAARQTQLVCAYFDGRAIRQTVYWYSPANIMGRDACPFFIRTA